MSNWYIKHYTTEELSTAATHQLVYKLTASWIHKTIAACFMYRLYHNLEVIKGFTQRGRKA